MSAALNSSNFRIVASALEPAANAVLSDPSLAPFTRSYKRPADRIDAFRPVLVEIASLPHTTAVIMGEASILDLDPHELDRGASRFGKCMVTYFRADLTDFDFARLYLDFLLALQSNV